MLAALKRSSSRTPVRPQRFQIYEPWDDNNSDCSDEDQTNLTSKENNFTEDLEQPDDVTDEVVRNNDSDESPNSQNVESNSQRKYVCRICGQGFISKDRKYRHQLKHTGTTHKCDVCSREFSSALSLSEHKALHDNKMLYMCEICHREFRQYTGLWRHLQTHSQVPQHTCSVCSKKFNRVDYLKSHLLTHQGVAKHVCNICRKIFLRRSDLKRHLLIHSNQRPFKCSFCESSFNCRSTRNRHQVECHTDKSLNCAICGVTFKRLAKLKAHILKVHFLFTKEIETNKTKDPCMNEGDLETQNVDGSPDSAVVPDSSSSAVIPTSLTSTTGSFTDPVADIPGPSFGDVDCNIPDNNSTVCDQSKTLTPTESVHEPPFPEIETEEMVQMQPDSSLYPEDTSEFAMEMPKAVSNNEGCTSTMDEQMVSLQELLNYSGDNNFVKFPDFSSQDYYNWLASFTSICKFLTVPLELEIFTKMTQVQKSVLDALALPTGVLCAKENYQILIGISDDLQKIIKLHLQYVVEHLQS